MKIILTVVNSISFSPGSTQTSYEAEAKASDLHFKHFLSCQGVRGGRRGECRLLGVESGGETARG